MSQEHSPENPLVVYTVLRSSLNLVPGKVAIQCQHITQRFMETYFKAMLLETKIHDITKEHNHVSRTTAFLKDGSQKVLLQATEEEYEEVKKQCEVCSCVRDAGKNGHVEPGTETLLVLWPVLKSEAPKIIQSLPIYTGKPIQ